MDPPAGLSLKRAALQDSRLASDVLFTAGMSNLMTKEGIHMDAAWRQILVAAVVIVTLIALGVLEVVTARLPVDQSVTARMKNGTEPAGPFQDFLVETSMTEASDK